VTRTRPIALCAVVLASACVLPSAAQADPGCGGLLQPPCPPPPPPPQDPPPQQQPPPPGEARISLRASKPYSVAGAPITFSGRVTGAPAGRSTRILLTSRAPAYKRQFLDISADTDENGRFRISARPPINSIFRVVVDRGQSVTGRSNPVAVRVYPGLNVDIGEDDYGNPNSIYMTISGPAQLYFKTETSAEAVTPRRGSARVAYFYGIPRHSKRAYKLGHGRIKTVDCDSSAAYCEFIAKWRLRRSRRLRQARRVLGCLHGTVFVGLGSVYPACGRKVIKLR
jgi:hypothetical protein